MIGKSQDSRSVSLPARGYFGPVALRSAVLFAALWAVVGCNGVSKEVYTLNPDGTGKVEFKLVQQLESPMQLGDGGGKSKDEKARDRVRNVLDASEGVEAWSDVTYKTAKINDEWRVLIRGTAYFRDPSKVKFAEQDRVLRARWTRGRNGRDRKSVV